MQDAENNPAKVLQRAGLEGAQVVTVRGVPTAVVLSINDYEMLRKARPAFADALLEGPLWSDELVDLIDQRSHEWIV